ncbi:FkbM family methyltransferase [Synechocystis sp. LKSZ1]|uniref:FkbM family methyltransferase n=1 Tax=Synechocystis sp. LKSZ1 TaxID=3144951 RepID=UPI00336C28E4
MSSILKQIRRKLFGLDEQEAALHRAIADTNELIANLQKSFDHLHLNYSRTLVEVVSQSHPQTQLSCLINELPLRMPVSVLRAYAHCLETSQKDSFNYRVESHCVDWLRQYLQPGDVFVDVGAAYGVISLPLADYLGPNGRVYAFEPARQTRQLLEQIITQNNIGNVTLLPQAISDSIGSAEFIEYSSDNPFAWASDTSTLAANVQPSQQHYQTYIVEITTLDHILEQQSICPQAIKIDIEGFELYALQGGQKTLDQYRPALCIDIHEDVRTKTSALLGVRPFLESLGYRLQLQEHTLFAAP